MLDVKAVGLESVLKEVVSAILVVWGVFVVVIPVLGVVDLD